MFLTGILALILVLSPALFMPGPAHADGISGFVEFTDSFTSATSSSAAAGTVETRANSFLQLYSLSFDRNLYPTLRLSAGGLFQKTMSDATTNGLESSADTTQMSPNITLTMGNPILSSAVGYARSEQTTSTPGTPSQTNVLETYTGRVGWRPEGLPIMDFLFSRSNSFDKAGSHENSTDSYTLSSRYDPLRNLGLLYSGSLTNSIDKLTQLETSSLSNAITGNYSQQFFAGRASLFANANLSDQETSVSASGATGGGFITTTPPASHGSFAASDNPTFIQRSIDDIRTPPIVFWTLFDELVTNNKITPIPLINLVYPQFGGDGRKRNMGLDLGGGTTVDSINVYIAPPQANQLPLPASITNQFTWAVYTSTDNVNWTLLADNLKPVLLQVFDPQLQVSVYRFELTFATVTTRYIKAVVNPLLKETTTPALNDVLVTKLEPLVRTPVAQIVQNQGHTSTSQAGLLNVGGRVLLLNAPSLPVVTYDVNFNYNFARSDSGTLTNYYLANGLSASHRFNEFLSGRARVSREDSEDARESKTSYGYSAGLEARPLSTLTHSLTYSGRYESTSGKSTTTNSVFLTNSAVLYQGASVNLSGGVSLASGSDGISNFNTIISCGANLVPHPSLSLNFNFSDQRSQQSGGGKPESSNYSRSGAMSVSYTPFETISIFGSIGFSAQQDTATTVTKAFGGSWSPFRDGAMQFNVSYNESVTTAGDQRVRAVSPSLRWNIRTGWWLETIYTYQTTTSSTAETTSDTITSSLRMSF